MIPKSNRSKTYVVCCVINTSNLNENFKMHSIKFKFADGIRFGYIYVSDCKIIQLPECLTAEGFLLLDWKISNGRAVIIWQKMIFFSKGKWTQPGMFPDGEWDCRALAPSIKSRLAGFYSVIYLNVGGGALFLLESFIFIISSFISKQQIIIRFLCVRFWFIWKDETESKLFS